jgi:hypothetical protein
MTNKGIPQARVPVPARLAHLPTDPEHGDLPVPYFIGSVRDASGVMRPDFRCVASGARERCDHGALCWICGLPLDGEFACVTGPMCLINRISSEPVSHFDCARYAVAACPFIATPGRKRREKDMPAGIIPPPASDSHNPRNPGAAVVLFLKSRPKRGGDDLYHLRQIESVEFYRAGVRIYGLDCLPAFAAGAQILAAAAGEEAGVHGLVEFLQRLAVACTLLFGVEMRDEAWIHILNMFHDLPDIEFALDVLYHPENYQMVEIEVRQ